ncbi:flagellar hook protein FlgE [Desulfitobacterium sp. LBE]|uniref:flagellar hook protein FlgE n=1 Tax=Desulfitobacterium sp. LBE TaxID=884086 RepID=UPI0011998F2B|nr:flagellar hook protein FlgE [Desulfitobacterium sp. LBE]TWH60086.1 flagellar hook protein FlgE [Desulfitobacterium sp. LBE]
MLRSLYSAISGLKNHQVKMDVIGNNIANVNTTGFKRSRVTFSTMLSQTMKGAGSPSANQGGTNPSQIGLGSMVSSIDQIMTPGSSQSTGKDTDMMIQGKGFFVLQNNGETVYSRAGAFTQDDDGTLTEPGTGAKVMGHMYGMEKSVDLISTTDEDESKIDWTTLEAIKFNIGENPPYVLSEATKIPPDAWVKSGDEWVYSNPSLIGVNATTTAPSATFDATRGTITVTTDPTKPASDADIYTFTITNLDGKDTDGKDIPLATLTSFSVDSKGAITGVYSNGEASASRVIGQVAIASFSNDAGLQNLGNSFYAASNNSGQASIGGAGEDGRGNIVPSTVEMSNVDLSQEFTDMIVTQRGFQANSRVITVSDSLLQELIDLKR